MAERVQVFKYLVDAAQATADAEKFNKTVEGGGKAAASGAAGVTTALSGQEKAARGAAVSGQQLQAVYQNVVRTQGANSAAAQALAAQLNNVSGAQRTVAATTAQVGASTAKTGVEMGLLERLLKTNTSQISSQGTVWAGYDASVQAVARSLGGLPILYALLISIGGQLIGSLIDLATAKEKNIKLNDDLISSDIALRDVKIGLREAAAVEADAIALLASFARNAKANESATQQWEAALGKLQHTQIEGSQIAVRIGDAMTGEIQIRNNTASAIRSQRESVAELKAAQQEQQTLVNKDIEGLLRLQRATNESTDSILRMARGLEIEEKLLGQLKEQLDSVTQARLRFREAMQAQKIPGFDTESTLEGARQLAEAIAGNMRGAIAEGASFRSAVLAQEGPLKQVQQTLRQHTLSLAGYREILKSLPDEVQKGIVEIDRIGRGMKVFQDNTRAAEAAAKAYANTISTMQKELATARAAVEGGATGDTFRAREAANLAKFEDMKRDLKRNNQATAESLKLAEQIYIAHDDKIQVDRMRAREELRLRIDAINAKAIGDEFDRHKAAIETRVEADIRAAKQLGFAEADLFGARIQFRKAREQEFLNWFFNESVKNAIAIEKALMQIQLEADREFIRTRAGLLQNQSDKFLGQQGRIGGLDQQFRQPGQAPLDINQLNQAAETMERLGVTVQDVDNIFGSSSSSIGQFTERLNILAGSNLSTIQTLKQLIDWQQVFVQVIGIAQQAISDLVSGSAKGGKAILASFLQMIAGIATTLGTLFLLAGAGFIVLPGFQWSGGALIAAGTALIVFAGVLGGLATLLTKDNAAAVTGAGGGATGAAGGGGDGNRERPPNVIPFPTTGGNQGGPSYNVIKLDRDGTRDFLRGEGVLTVDDAKGVGPNSRGFWGPSIREARRQAKSRRAG